MHKYVVYNTICRLWSYRLAMLREAIANKLQSNKYGETSIMKWEVRNLV